MDTTDNQSDNSLSSEQKEVQLDKISNDSSSNPSTDNSNLAKAAMARQKGATTDDKNLTEKSDLTERLKQAQLAMQGPERFALSEQRALESKIKDKENKIKQRLSEITKLKESLEINWVALDNKRTALKKILSPILKEEEEIELEEDRLEGEERITPLPEERKRIEKQRWKIQDKRREQADCWSAYRKA